MSTDFSTELEHLLNRHARELPSNTPDFVLAKFLLGCLDAFHEAAKARDTWYGTVPRPGQSCAIVPHELYEAWEKAGFPSDPHVMIPRPPRERWYDRWFRVKR